jgi:sec-independent protein translocase protein TatC
MLSKYFIEIRNRLILVILSWVIALTISYLNKETLLFLLIKPNIALFENKFFYFIATNLTDMFSAYLHLSYFVAFQAAVSFGAFQFKAFITPALYKKELKHLQSFYLLSICFLLIGVFFLNNIILPCCWKFFLSFQSSPACSINIFLEMRVTEYLSLYILIYYVVIFVGQTFVFTFLIIDTLEKKLSFVRKTRKLFYLVFFAFATLITPPDIISQVFLGISFIAFYELIVVTIILKSFKIS